MPTIINIRGTSGSGKSTVAREIMKLYQPNPLRYREEGRKQPLGYRYKAWPTGPDLAVVGHYETDCGGADTIPDYVKLVRLVREGAEAGMDVLFEGLLFSGDVKRTVDLAQWAVSKGHALHVIAMQMDLDVCVASVNERRANKAARLGRPPKGDVNPKNTIAKHRGLTLACSRLEAEGVTVHRPVGREATLGLCKQLLGFK
jgi:hypothetical protein